MLESLTCCTFLTSVSINVYVSDATSYNMISAQRACCCASWQRLVLTPSYRPTTEKPHTHVFTSHTVVIVYPPSQPPLSIIGEWVPGCASLRRVSPEPEGGNPLWLPAGHAGYPPEPSVQPLQFAVPPHSRPHLQRPTPVTKHRFLSYSVTKY